MKTNRRIIAKSLVAPGLVLLLAAALMLVGTGVVADKPATKVDICHREGNGTYHLITVSERAVPAHLARGDGFPGELVPGMPGKKFDESCNVVDAGPTVHPGYDPNATLKAAVKYRALINPGGLQGFEGIMGPPSFPSGSPQNDFYRGAACDGSTPYGSWNATNHVKFTYDGTGTLTAQVDANPSYCMTHNIGSLGPLNYLQLDVVNRATGTTVNFNNVTLNGYPLGDFTASGWNTWYAVGLDLSLGFTVEGDLVLAWPTPPATSGQETNKLQITAGHLP